MILRLSSEQLRSIADQLDALTTIRNAGGTVHGSDRVLSVGDDPLCYVYWWEDERRFLADITSFTPGDRVPMPYHDDRR